LKDYQKESSDVIDKIASLLDIVNKWSNGSVKELVTTLKGKDTIPEITTMENLKETLNILLDKLLIERGDKLVVFVDELDRCNPIYAIKLLERIKHFFDHENIIFVFSVNVKELTNTISNYYGQSFDSHRYLNKFFDVSIDLPQVNVTDFMQFLGLNKNTYYFNKNVFEIINHYQGRDMMRIHLLPLLLGIKIIDLKSYIDIISGNGYENFIEVIKQIETVRHGLKHYLDKNQDGKISEESYNKQLLEIYNAIFNNKLDSYREYTNSVIELNIYSYEYMMETLSLLKKGLKY